MEITEIASDNPGTDEATPSAATQKPRCKGSPTQTISRPPIKTVEAAKALVIKMEQMRGCFVGYSYLIELLLKVIIRNGDELEISQAADEAELLLALEKAITINLIKKIQTKE
jgi:hypothetical protein